MQFDRTNARVIARAGEWVFETGLRYGPRMVLTAGWSDVADGDLSPLLDLPGLEHVVFEDRAHYSHRAADFPELPMESIVGWREQATRELDERILGPATGTGPEGEMGR